MGAPITGNPFNKAGTTFPVFGTPAPGAVAYPEAKIFLTVENLRRQTRIDWARKRGLTVSRISYGLGPSDDTMILTWAPDAERRDREHLGDLLEILQADRRVQAYTIVGKRDLRLLFSGYPQVESMQWTGRNQSMQITCLSEGQEKLRAGWGQQILGRYMRIDPTTEWDQNAPDLKEITSRPVIFNAGGRPNRSADPVEMASEEEGGPAYAIYLFADDDAAEARYWSYGDALRYVLYLYVLNAGAPVDVVPFLADTDQFVGEPHLPSSDPFVAAITRRCDDDVSVQSVNVDEAVALLTQSARLAYGLPLTGATQSRGGFAASYTLTVFGHLDNADAEVDDFRRQRQPVRHDLPRDPPFSDFSNLTDRQVAERNACDAARLEVDQRTIARPVFVGGAKEYEGTFLLRPGWEPHEHLDDVGGEEQADSSVTTAINYWKEQFEPEYDSSEKRSPRSIYHTEHPDHASVADVFRLWLFPDSPEIDHDALKRNWGPFTEEKYEVFWQDDEGNKRLWYSHPIWGPGLPYSITQSWVPRRRPFLDTIGRSSTATTNRSPIVRAHFGRDDGQVPSPLDDDWKDVTAHVEVDLLKGAIRLTEANILNAGPFLSDPEDKYGLTAIEQYIRRAFWVSVTAVVRGDQRMEHRPQPAVATGPQRVQVIDLGYERYQYRRRRLGNSHLRDRFDVAAFEDRNDTEMLQKYADALAGRMVEPRVAGNPSMFFLTDAYKPGDVVTGCTGLALEWNYHPQVTRVSWVSTTRGIRTDLILTDTRETPENA